MTGRKVNPAFLTIIICILYYFFSGCATQSNVIRKQINRESEEVGFHGPSKKYIKNGITVVYLTGTPYEMGFEMLKWGRATITGRDN